MRKALLSSLFMFAFCLLGYSQYSGIKKFNLTGYDTGFDLVEKSNRELATTGYLQNGTNYNAMFYTCDSSLNITGTASFTNLGDEGGYRMKKTSDGGYFMMGYITNGSGQYYPYALKVDAAFTKQWDYKMTTITTGWLSDPLYDGMETSDGNFVIVAFGATTATAIKLSSTGSVVWTKIYSNASYARSILTSVVEMNDGNYLCGGYVITSPPNPYYKALLVKFDRNTGNILSQPLFSIAGTDFSINSLVSDGSNYIGTGSYGADKCMVIKVNQSLVQVWRVSRSINNDSTVTSATSTSIKKTKDNNFVIAGYYGDVEGKHTFLIKVSTSNGAAMFNKNFKDPATDRFSYGVEPTYDGGYALIGYHSESPDYNTHIIKTDATGQICNNFPFISVATNTVTAGNPTTFTPNIAGGNGTLTYSWIGAGGFSSATPSPSHTYSANGTYNYTVQVTDGSGCVGQYVGTATVGSGNSINDLYLNSQVELFPNPTHDIFNLKFTDALNNKTTRISICDMTGKEFLSGSYKISSSGNVQIDIQRLTPGIYFVKCKIEGECINNKLVVK